jgi:hypothetical protein
LNSEVDVDVDEVMKTLKKAFGLDHFESSERTSGLLVVGAAVLTILFTFFGHTGAALLFSLFWVAFVAGGAKVLSPVIDNAWNKATAGAGSEEQQPLSGGGTGSESSQSETAAERASGSASEVIADDNSGRSKADDLH